jgi:uncharacterized protein YkwD
MKGCRSLRVWVVRLVVLAGLLGPSAVLADPALPGLSPGYALGYYAPQEQIGHLSTSAEAPSGALSAEPANSYEEEVVRLINVERLAAGLPPYKFNAVLAAVAETHSALMRDQDCFDHQCPGEPAPAERVCAAGYGAYGWGDCFVGETIAAGFVDPASVVAAWMASPGHHSVLMHGTLREIGVGYVSGGYYGDYWTVDFGSQPDVLPVFIDDEDAETASREVTLTLTNEEVSGWDGIDYALEVMISNDPGFAGAEWEGYELHKPWTLAAGNGLKTVYVKYRDPTGYEVTSTDTILLDEPVQYDLEVSSHALAFTYKIGYGFTGSPTAGIEVLNSASSQPMTWNANASEPWLGFDPGGGTTPGELKIDVSSFEAAEAGTSETTVTVTSPQAPEGAEEVRVTIQVVDQVYRHLLPFVVRAGP